MSKCCLYSSGGLQFPQQSIRWDKHSLIFDGKRVVPVMGEVHYSRIPQNEWREEVRKIGFEGGQMPLQRRVPKAGFKNINHKEYFAVNLSTLQALAEAKNLTKIGIAELKEAGLTNGKVLVKVLGNGELKAKLEVEANAFSKTAEEAIKAVGGNATII